MGTVNPNQGDKLMKIPDFGDKTPDFGDKTPDLLPKRPDLWEKRPDFSSGAKRSLYGKYGT